MVKRNLLASIAVASSAVSTGSAGAVNQNDSTARINEGEHNNNNNNNSNMPIDPNKWYQAPSARMKDHFSKQHPSRTIVDPKDLDQERVAKHMSSLRPSDERKLTRLSKKELDSYASKSQTNNEKDNFAWLRRMGWGGESSSSSPYELEYLADPGAEWDMWQQGYRMLGGFIDCDHDKNSDRRRRKLGDEGEQNERDLSGSDDRGDDYGCSRWMMWAAYVDPNYQGGGYREYHPYDGEEAVGALDCHESDTEWVLMGVYREEFYQYLEQISKHLWAIDEYEYIVVLAGLAYMSDTDCYDSGLSDNSGNTLYAGIQPLPKGKFQISLYSDKVCLTLNEDTSYTFDDAGYASDVNLGSKDEEGDDKTDDVINYWEASQEYTLTNMNGVYETFKYCTLCMDYPTYQDGYFIGDYGTDEDDLINQCWKFHSHDSFTCETDCIKLGHQQGTITQLYYGDRVYGEKWDGTSSTSSSFYHGNEPSKMDKLKANVFVTVSGILFIATFLAFAVARGSGALDKSGKSRSLLTDEEKALAKSAQRTSRRSKSRSRDKDSSRRSSHRSKSRGPESERRRRKNGEEREKSRTRSKRSSSRKGESRSKSGRSSSRRHIDDF